jgi:hypothetical protein
MINARNSSSARLARASQLERNRRRKQRQKDLAIADLVRLKLAAKRTCTISHHEIETIEAKVDAGTFRNRKDG